VAVPEIPLSQDPVVQDLAKQHPQIRQALRDHGLIGEIAKPPGVDAATGLPTGGIGFAPTVEEARAMFSSHRAMHTMMEDIQSGDPNRQARFVQHFFGAANGTPNEAANAILEMQPDILIKVNPDGFVRQANRYTGYQVQLLRAKAAAEANPEIRARHEDAARWLEFVVTGDWQKTPEEQAAEASRVRSPEEVELARLRTSIDTEKQAIAERQQRESTRQFHKNMDHVVGAQNQARKALVKGALGTALEGLDQNYQNYVIAEFDKRVQAEVDLTPDRKAIVLAEGRSLAKNGQMEHLNTYLDKRYRALLMPGIQKHRSEFVRAAAGQRAADIQRQIPTPERASQLQASAQNRNPGGAAAVPTSQPMANTERKPGESGIEWAKRSAMARLSVA